MTTYRRVVMTITVTVAALAAPIGLLGTAAADDKVPLGGGAGIALNGGTLCTLTTIGNDSAGELVGITSAHCGGRGASVAAEGTAGTVGSVVVTDEALDYAVIKFDATNVAPVAYFDGFAINGVGPELREVESQMACQQSRATGHACAIILAGTHTAYECGNPGDDGAPVTVNDLLVGMIRGGFTPDGSPCPQIHGILAPHPYFPPRLRPEIVSINAILADLNAKGGPGAGFAPIPG